jgi:hypothetical protein
MKKSLFLTVSVILIAIISQFHTRLNAANSYFGVQKGMIHLAYVEYKDSDTVTVTSGYGECNGHYWEVSEPIDHDMTSLTTAEDFHYIYIDDANSIYADPIIIDNTTEPVWSNAKLGWYNGNDRCIGVVWSPAGSATIMEYVITPDIKWVSKNNGEYIKMVLEDGNPNGAWNSVDCSSYIPVNAQAARIVAANTDPGAPCRVDIVTTDSYNIKMGVTSYNAQAMVREWLELPRGSSRGLLWNGDNDDDNGFYILVTGFQIER